MFLNREPIYVYSLSGCKLRSVLLLLFVDESGLSLRLSLIMERCDLFFNEINKLFNRTYQQLDELVRLSQERGKKYRYSEYSSCEDCEDFFKTYIFVDIIGYSFVKNPVAEHPIDDKTRIVKK